MAVDDVILDESGMTAFELRGDARLAADFGKIGGRFTLTVKPSCRR
jgi:hypothetical protein